MLESCEAVTQPRNLTTGHGMKISFIDHQNGGTLGEIAHSGFTEILIPAYHEDKHDIFITCKFNGRDTVSRWKIINLVTAANTTTIRVDECKRSLISLKVFSESQNTAFQNYLAPYRIVEVDFGFYSDCFSIGGSRNKNHTYSSSLFPGEMHKRRPCIVLSSGVTGVQVVPMTTLTLSATNPKCILVSKRSFENMSAHYSNCDSYAITDMVQTVSPGRVYPPMDKRGKHPAVYAQYELASEDRTKLVSALAKLHSPDMVTSNENLERRLQSKSTEVVALRKGMNSYREEGRELKNELSLLKARFLRLGGYTELSTDYISLCAEVDDL
jgi:uncharacterized protein YifN (PemK superfamily)